MVIRGDLTCVTLYVSNSWQKNMAQVHRLFLGLQPCPREALKNNECAYSFFLFAHHLLEFFRRRAFDYPVMFTRFGKMNNLDVEMLHSPSGLCCETLCGSVHELVGASQPWPVLQFGLNNVVICIWKDTSSPFL